MASLEYTRQAARELRAIRRWIAIESGAERADRVLERLVAAAGLLAERPLVGRERGEIASGLRSFPVWPYVIFYLSIARGCRIMRVVHGHQDLGRIFGRPGDAQP